MLGIQTQIAIRQANEEAAKKRVALRRLAIIQQLCLEFNKDVEKLEVDNGFRTAVESMTGAILKVVTGEADEQIQPQIQQPNGLIEQ